MTCQRCQCVALLSSMVGHMLPCGWQQTQAVYFACTAKRLRLGSPFLFSQWKGEIDGYHLCAEALFERYQTFHRHHWILFWANKHMCTHSRTQKKPKCVSFICPQFSVFAVGTREEGVEGGGCLSLYSFKTAAYSCTTMHSSHNDKSVSK